MKTDIFRTRQMNQEGTKWGITVGEHLATPKTFKTEAEANKHLAWLEKIPWETIVAVVAEMIEIHERNKSSEEPEKTE